MNQIATLEMVVREFGAANSHLASKEKSEEEVFVAQFVSKCQAPSGRNAFALTDINNKL